MRVLIAVSCCLLLSGLARTEAASYTEDFSPAPPSADWTSYNRTWITTNGDLRNEKEIQQLRNPEIAVYNKATWQKNFVLNAKIYGDYPAEANRVGVVFG